jgi:hypothetical protein
MKKKMEMWPVFQKEMHAILDGLKKVANGAGGGLLKSGVEAGVVDTVSWLLLHFHSIWYDVWYYR